MARNLRRRGIWPELVLGRFVGATRSLETLAYDEFRVSPEKPYSATAFVLHGLLGSGRNWKTFSRNLASEISSSSSSSTEWRMVLIDLRNHGKSAAIKGLEPPHNIENAAKDVANLVKVQDWAWPDVIIGHSMGGKVALEFLRSCAGGFYGESAALPKQVWVLDSVPGEVNPEESDGEVEKVLQTLQNLPPHLPSRRWVVDHMLKLGFSKSLAEWIASNLKKSGNQVTWAFNLQGAFEMFSSYSETNYWPLLENPPKGSEIALVQAENSDRWSPHVLGRLQSLSSKHEEPEKGRFSLHVLPNAGHWVHVDNPKGLQEIMLPKLLSIG